MTADRGRPSVRQLRLVVEADDYEDAIRFYRDVLGLDRELSVETPWRSLSSRLGGPAGLQLTVFEELAPEHAG